MACTSDVDVDCFTQDVHLAWLESFPVHSGFRHQIQLPYDSYVVTICVCEGVTTFYLCPEAMLG